MGERIALLVTYLLVISLRAQVRAQEELSKEGIVCITQNQEKTALERWLHCLQTTSIIDTKNAEVESFQIIEESAFEQFTEPKEFDQLTGHKEVEQLIEYKDILADVSAAHNDFSGGGEVKEGVLRLDSENAEDDGPIERTRASEENAVLSWLKLNLATLALCRLLFGLVKKCSRRIDHKGSLQTRMMNLTENSGENASEISKTTIANDTISTNHSATANLQMLGSSLGSVVGAVFSEVLSKSCSSGSPVPKDKICMILEIALKDLSLLVQEDDCCSRLVRDFLTSFKITYSTMYRIHQACASHGGPGVTESKEDNRSSIIKSTCEKECKSAKSNVEVIHTQRNMDLEDDASSQVKEELPLPNGSGKSKVESLKSRSVWNMDASPEVIKSSRQPIAALGELDLGARATPTSNHHGSESNKTHMKIESHKIPSYVGGVNPSEETLNCTSADFTNEIVTHLEYTLEDASSVCEEPLSIISSNAVGRLNPLFSVSHSYGSTPFEFQKDLLKLYERDVQAQELHNRFKCIELQQLVKQQNIDEEKIQLASEANGLLRENIDLDRSKAVFKESRVLEEQAKAAHMSFCTLCADELAAGLCVMLAALVYSVRMYSFALLNDLVSMCQPAMKEYRRSAGFHIDWFYNSLDSVAGKLQAIVCHFAVTGRILIGSILVGMVAQLLLRRSVTNSSQAMPATILIIVLGGVCGFVGKLSIDSLGGSGTRWWVVWGTLCLLHALVNWFTPSIHRLLHGSSTRPKSRFGPPFWIRRLAFHSTLVLFLPLLAGLLPFGIFSRVMSDLFFTLLEISGGVYVSICEWAVLSFQK